MVIYKVVNETNQKVYIGQTTQEPHARRMQHKYEAFNRRLNKPFYNAIRRDGWNSFQWEIIDEADSTDELNQKEIYWIDFYDSANRDKGYNLSTGGDSNSGYRSNSINYSLSWTDERRKEKSEYVKEYRKNNPYTEEEKKKISDSLKEFYSKNPHHSVGVKGEIHHSSKLTNQERLEIYDLYTSGLFTGREIGELYGVTKTRVYQLGKQYAQNLLMA